MLEVSEDDEDSGGSDPGLSDIDNAIDIAADDAGNDARSVKSAFDDDGGGDDDEEEEDDFNLDAVDYREGKENEEIQEGVVIAEEGDNADDIEELQDKHGDIEDADVGHHQMAIDIEDDERANANKKEGGDAGEDGFGEIAAFELDEAEAAQQMFNANAGGENMIEFKAKRFTQNETSSSSACLTRKASELK